MNKARVHIHFLRVICYVRYFFFVSNLYIVDLTMAVLKRIFCLFLFSHSVALHSKTCMGTWSQKLGTKAAAEERNQNTISKYIRACDTKRGPEGSCVSRDLACFLSAGTRLRRGDRKLQQVSALSNIEAVAQHLAQLYRPHNLTTPRHIGHEEVETNACMRCERGNVNRKKAKNLRSGCFLILMRHRFASPLIRPRLLH